MSKLEYLKVTNLNDSQNENFSCGLVMKLKVDTEENPRRLGMIIEKTAEPRLIAKHFQAWANSISDMVDDAVRDFLLGQEKKNREE